MPDIPRYVKYDFLITLLGLICVASAWYYSQVSKLGTGSTNILFLIGVPFVIWGFTEMYNNYADEQDLKQLNLILEKRKVFDQIIKRKIVSKDAERDFAEYLKKEFEEVFEKSKSRRIE